MKVCIYHKTAVKPTSEFSHTDIFNNVLSIKNGFRKITFVYWGLSTKSWNKATFYKNQIVGYSVNEDNKEVKK